MSYIKLIESPTGKAKEILDGVEKQLGMVPNIFKGFANSPAVLEAYLSFNSAISKGALSPKIRESLAIAIANLNQCEYCASAHTALGKNAGLDESETKMNLESKSTCEKTQAALNFAKSIVINKGKIHDKDLANVKDAGFTDEEVVEIIAVTSINIFTNYFNHIAGTKVDFPLVKLCSTSCA